MMHNTSVTSVHLEESSQSIISSSQESDNEDGESRIDNLWSQLNPRQFDNIISSPEERLLQSTQCKWDWTSDK